MQTGKSYLAPVVMLEPPGDTYWDTWREFVERELLGAGLISEHDLDFVFITDSVDDAVAELCRFFHNYDSMRFVGSRLVVRLNRELTTAELAELNRDFADIVSEGDITKIDATPSEIDDDDHVDKARIAFRFDRASYARLRQMVRRINDFG